MWNVKTGEELYSTPLSPSDFAEGLAIVDDFVLVLTWREKRLYWLRKSDLSIVDVKYYPYEGYGLAWDPEARILFATKGDNVIHRFKVDTRHRALSEIGRSHVVVSERGRPFPLRGINEMEWISIDTSEYGVSDERGSCGFLLANVWMTRDIFAIEPFSGEVLGRYDMSSPFADEFQRLGWDADYNSVLNGIAQLRIFGASGEVLGTDAGEVELPVKVLLTGKNWSRAFEVEVPRELLARARDRCFTR